MDKRAFGQALTRERERRGMTADGFAHALGLTAEAYAAYERGDELPSLSLAKNFADALGVPLDTLTDYSYVPPLRMGREDGTSKEEKEALERELENAAIMRYNRGRTIMKLIIIIEAVFAGLDFLLGGFLSFAGIIAAVIEIVILVCLYNGKTWARTVFVIIKGFAVFINLLSVGATDGSLLFYIISIVIIAWQVASCVLLCASKSVEEFLYEQSTIH